MVSETTWANPPYRRRDLRKAVGKVDRDHPLACADCFGQATGSMDSFNNIQACPTCSGYGITCPGCRGSRFVRVESARTPEGAPTGPTGVYLAPCPRCTVTLNGLARYSETRELEAMEAWWDADVPF